MSETKVEFYTVGCPHCETLKKYLGKFNIEYQEIDVSEDMDMIDKFENMGFNGFPVLNIDGQYYGYEDAKEKIIEIGRSKS